MSEKQFDHIENRIREAADNSEPDFDDYAWKLMEARLDEADKNKRRPILWLITFTIPFIIGGTLYFFGKINPDEIQNKQQDKFRVAESKTPIQKNNPANSKQFDKPIIDSHSKVALNKSANSGVDLFIKESNGIINVTATDSNSGRKKKGNQTKGELSLNRIAGEITEIEEPATNFVEAEASPGKYSETSKPTDNQVPVAGQDPPIKKDTSLPVEKKNTKNIKESKPSRFYFLAAAGIDAGSVKFLNFENSEVVAKYGIGIGYRLSKKLSIQSGFYASDKKYIAGPEDYYAKPGSYWSSVQLVKVDASCLVYDIPLTFRYDLIQKPKAGYFATAGISTYIMQEENYNYYYLRYNMPREAAKTYTGNKDMFAVFNLSVGLEKKLSPIFYIQAEPSIGIPLSGVGEGSVKLYSAALQVALKYQPRKRH